MIMLLKFEGLTMIIRLTINDFIVIAAVIDLNSNFIPTRVVLIIIVITAKNEEWM
jgi:hypothetical protein